MSEDTKTPELIVPDRKPAAMNRRQLLTRAGVAGMGAAALLGGGGLTSRAFAQTSGAATDTAVLQFALQLEYLEAEFYLRAVGLPSVPNSGNAPVKGGRKVNFTTPAIRAYANEIARDERAHVIFLRNALGENSTPRPALNFTDAFAAAAQAAGLGGGFDAFANETNFLLGAFIFEDVGVTAYKGAAPLLTNKNVLSAAAGILAVEAYHAANVAPRSSRSAGRPSPPPTPSPTPATRSMARPTWTSRSPSPTATSTSSPPTATPSPSPAPPPRCSGSST